MTRYIAYSTASMSALAEASDQQTALDRALSWLPITDEFLVVATVTGHAPLEDLDRLPRSAKIIWRGENELAQRFRRR